MSKYFIYCRKSSEEEERQALSIESQLQELREYAGKHKLLIVDEFIESKSARKPDNRPIFNEVLEKITEGKADGILSWAPDRISRNAIEGGKVIHLVDQGIIKDLKFPSFHFQPDPQGLFNLSLAFSFGKLYVDNLSQNIKRGIREKIRRGQFPGMAPLGYFNHHKTRTIEADPETFHLIKRLIENYADGNLSFSEIMNKMFEAGIKTRYGTRINYSTILAMLENPFYHGVFRLKGELHQGSHPPMISKETFDRIQKRLASRIRAVDWSEKSKNEKGFLFDEIGRCGECGYSVIREYHQKKSGLEFRYYRCSKKSKTHKCKQKPINEKDLATQVESLVSDIAIDDYWYEWCLNTIETWRDEEKGSADQQINDLDAELSAYREKLERLLDIHIEGVINSKEYKQKKNKMINDYSSIEDKISKIKANGSDWFEPLKDSLKLSNKAFHSVLKKDYVQMGKILKNVGLNPTFKEKTYNLDYSKPFCFFREVSSGLSIQNSPEQTPLEKKLESQTRGGSQGTGGGVSSSRAGTTLLPSCVAASCARRPKGAERLVAESASELTEKWSYV